MPDVDGFADASFAQFGDFWVCVLRIDEGKETHNGIGKTKKEAFLDAFSKFAGAKGVKVEIKPQAAWQMGILDSEDEGEEEIVQ